MVTMSRGFCWLTGRLPHEILQFVRSEILPVFLRFEVQALLEKMRFLSLKGAEMFKSISHEGVPLFF